MTNDSRNSPTTYRIDIKRLSRYDRIVAVATLVFFISLYLPWFGVGVDLFHVSVDGLWHGYMYIALVVSVAVVAYFVLVAGFRPLPVQLPMPPPQFLLLATGVNLVLSVFSFLTRPSGSSWEYGAFTGLFAAFVAFAPTIVPGVRARVLQG